MKLKWLQQIRRDCLKDGFEAKADLRAIERVTLIVSVWGQREGDDRGWDGWMASLTPWT